MRLRVVAAAAAAATTSFAAVAAAAFPSPPCAAPHPDALPLESLCFTTLATAPSGASVRAYSPSIGAVATEAPEDFNFTSGISYGIEGILPYFYQSYNARQELINRTVPFVSYETDPGDPFKASWHTFLGLPASRFPDAAAAPRPSGFDVVLESPFADAARLVAALPFSTAASPSEAQWRAACAQLLAGLPAGYAPVVGAPLALALYNGRGAASFTSECWATVQRSSSSSSGGGGGGGGTYTNPVVLGDVPDPGVIRVNGSWLAATTGGDGRGSYFQIHASEDLASWAPAGYLFSAATWPRWADGTAWAPEVHEVSPGAFVVYFVSKIDGVLAVGAASASSPAGPFTDRGAPLVRAPAGACFGVIDPTYWLDPASGQRYVVFKDDGNSCGQHTNIYAAPLSADGLNVTGAATLLMTNDAASWEGGCTEAPWVVQRGQYTYLFYTGSVYNQPSYAVGVARSSAGILGPFVKNPANPLLRSAPGATPGNSLGLHYGPGHVSVVALASGGHAIVYAAEEPSGSGRRNIMLDAIVWNAAGWPTVAGGVPSDTPQPVPA